jgi:hypothetical protein
MKFHLVKVYPHQELTLPNITSPRPLPEQHGWLLGGRARSKMLLGICINVNVTALVKSRQA